MIRVLILFLFSIKIYAVKDITIYTYHNKPPFIEDYKKKVGLSFKLVDLFNKYSKKYKYNLLYIPRKRLNFIEEKKIVLWANEGWVKHPDTYLWTTPLLPDGDIIISNSENKINYTGPKSIYGKQILGIRGYIYPNLKKDFDNKKIYRVDTNSEFQIATMIASKRYDGGIMSLSTLLYLFNKREELNRYIHYSKVFQEKFERKLYVSKDSKDIYKELVRILSKSEFKKEFTKAKESYLFLD